MKSIDLVSAYGQPVLGSTTNRNDKDDNFSTISGNVNDVYVVDQIGHVLASPGTGIYAYSGGGGKKRRGVRAK